MTTMYAVTIQLPGTNPATSLCRGLESALQAIAEGLAGQVAPGRRVRWEVGCPSGRTAVGSLTVNAAGSDGRTEIADHIEIVRDVLIEEARDERLRA